jgi:hypothetical protein
MLLWTSGPGARDYTRGTHEFGSTGLPDGIAEQIVDVDHNGVPDSVEKRSIEDLTKAKDKLVDTSKIGYSGSIFDVRNSGDEMNIAFDDGFVDKMSEAADMIANGLSCGFGGGSCMSFPINWAPLAPGSVPSVFGQPLGSLKVSTGIPVFAGMTWMPVSGYCIPSVWPLSILGTGCSGQ